MEKVSGTYCSMANGLGLAPTIALGADLRKVPDTFVRVHLASVPFFVPARFRAGCDAMTSDNVNWETLREMFVSRKEIKGSGVAL